MSSSAILSLAVIRSASRLVEVVLFAQKHHFPSFELHMYTKHMFCKTGAILSARRRFADMGRNSRNEGEWEKLETLTISSALVRRYPYINT